MATWAALRPIDRRQEPDLHAVSRTALYVLCGIGSVFSGLLATTAWLALPGPHQQGAWSLTSTGSVAGNVVQALAASGLFVASLAGIVGLGRRRAWGRLCLTYACGLWAASLVFLPVSIGLMAILWHPDLPDRPRRLVDGVIAGIQDRDSRPSGVRAAVTALLAVTALVFIVHSGAVLLTDAAADSAGFVLAMAVFTVIEAIVFGIAIVGVGRARAWGRPVALFACGMCLFSFLAYPLTLAVLLILLRSRSLRDELGAGAGGQGAAVPR